MKQMLSKQRRRVQRRGLGPQEMEQLKPIQERRLGTRTAEEWKRNEMALRWKKQFQRIFAELESKGLSTLAITLCNFHASTASVSSISTSSSAIFQRSLISKSTLVLIPSSGTKASMCFFIMADASSNSFIGTWKVLSS